MRDENIARGHLIRKMEKLNQPFVELESMKAELKQVQELLQKERETFFPILHKAPYGIALIDNDGKFIYINPAFTNITGYTLEDIFTGRDWFHRASPFPEYRQEIISSLKRDVIEKGVEKIFSVVCKNGEIKEIEFKPTLLDDGRIVVILSDITEHKRAEEALKESEEKYRTILENIEDGYFEVDIAGNFTFFNDSLCRMLGYSKDEMIGMNNRRYTDQENAKKLYQAFNKVYTTGEPIKGFGWEVVAKDGTKLFGEVSVSLIKDSKGQPIGFRGIARDITERKRAEGVLRRSEEALKRLAQENAIIAEIGRIINSTLNIEEVYRHFAEEVRKLISFDRISINIINPERTTGIVAYAVGVDVKDKRPGDTFPLKGSLTEEVMRAQSSLLVQTEDIEELKTQYPALLTAFQVGLRSMMSIPIFSKDKVIGSLQIRSLKPNAYTETDMRLAERVSNQIAGAIANTQLLAEIKQAEELLKKEREIFFTTLRNAPYGILMVNPDNQCLYANSEFINITGYTLQDVPTITEWFNNVFLDSKYRERAIENWKKDRLSGKTVDRESNITCKSGKIKRLEIRVVFLEDNNVVVAFYDVTERKRAEEEKVALQEQLRQSQKMEAIGRLAGGIAHDFNNLLTVIKGYSQLSLMELKEGDPLRGNIEEIQKSSQRAVDLTRHLLAFSRRQVMEMRVLNLNTILIDMDKMLRGLIGEDIELVTHLPDDLGSVKIDPGQIEQVVMNLAVNARDAMPNGGKLTIETANVELDQAYARTHVAVVPGSYVMISVSDTGVGMAPEVRDEIFEPFFTTKERGKGTGLGLSTVYGIVKQSGGNIWVYSELGKGTTFKIYLPRVHELLEEVRKEILKDELPRGIETILVVEDEEDVRELCVRILEKQGYEVLEASCGDDALVLSKEHKKPIHMILTDVVMPGMSGRELANQLKSLHPKMMVLYMSGYTNDAIVHHGVLDEGINYVQKPFTVDGLTKRVREVLDKDSKPTD